MFGNSLGARDSVARVIITRAGVCFGYISSQTHKPMFNIVLHNPKIPPNTGNIIRLMANTGFKLHLIEPLGFDFEEKSLRRAGLDYHDLAQVSRHQDFASFVEQQPSLGRIFAITTKGTRAYTDIEYEAGDVFLFGSETEGLPSSVFQEIPESRWLRIPMRENNRSLNLSNSVAIVVFEAWRQVGFAGAQ